jgi:hypothetical protein
LKWWYRLATRSQFQHKTKQKYINFSEESVASKSSYGFAKDGDLLQRPSHLKLIIPVVLQSIEGGARLEAPRQCIFFFSFFLKSVFSPYNPQKKAWGRGKKEEEERVF